MQDGDLKFQIDTSYHNTPYWMDKTEDDDKRMCLGDTASCSGGRGKNVRIGDCDIKDGTARDTTILATRTTGPIVTLFAGKPGEFTADSEQYSNLQAWNLKGKHCSTNPRVDSNITAANTFVNYSLKNTIVDPKGQTAPYVTWMQEIPIEPKDSPLDQTLEDGVYLRHAFDANNQRNLMYVPENYNMHTPIETKPYLSSATEDCVYNKYGRSYDRCKFHAYKANMRADEMNQIRINACCENRLADVDPSVKQWCSTNYGYSKPTCQAHYKSSANKAMFQAACCLGNQKLSSVTKNIGIDYSTSNKEVYDDDFEQDVCGEWLSSVDSVNQCKQVRQNSIKNIENVKKACCANNGTGDYSLMTQADFDENIVRLSDFNNYQQRKLCIKFHEDGLIACEGGAPTPASKSSGFKISNSTLLYGGLAVLAVIILIVIFKRRSSSGPQYGQQYGPPYEAPYEGPPKGSDYGPPPR